MGIDASLKLSKHFLTGEPELISCEFLGIKLHELILCVVGCEGVSGSSHSFLF